MADAGDGGSDGAGVAADGAGDWESDGAGDCESDGAGVPDGGAVSGEVSAEGPGLGLAGASDGDGEAGELAQPTRRMATSSDGARFPSIRGGLQRTTSLTPRKPFE